MCLLLNINSQGFVSLEPGLPEDSRSFVAMWRGCGCVTSASEQATTQFDTVRVAKMELAYNCNSTTELNEIPVTQVYFVSSALRCRPALNMPRYGLKRNT